MLYSFCVYGAADAAKQLQFAPASHSNTLRVVLSCVSSHTTECRGLFATYNYSMCDGHSLVFAANILHIASRAFDTWYEMMKISQLFYCRFNYFSRYSYNYIIVIADVLIYVSRSGSSGFEMSAE